ncbi:MAG TPA: hypothetical protein VGI60_00140 [Chthoniobacterales bacterium]
MLISQYELAFEHVDKFRALMGMEGKFCAGLESDNLHLQPSGNSNVFNKHSCGEG